MTNKEKARERSRLWRLENRDAYLKYQKEYHEKNREELLERRKKRDKEYYDENADAIRERRKKYYSENRDSCLRASRKCFLSRMYNMTQQDYLDMLEEQGGKCAGCGLTIEESRRRLDIDHDHKTGEVRGLLCAPCNLHDVLGVDN